MIQNLLFFILEKSDEYISENSLKCEFNFLDLPKI